MSRTRARTKPPAITPELAAEFFDQLEENEQHMGEQAAIAVTLEQFGFENHDMSAYVDLAKAHRTSGTAA